jgi:hypothetical protein
MTNNKWAYSLDNGNTFHVCPSLEDAVAKARDTIDHRYAAGVPAEFVVIEIAQPVTHVYISGD